MKALRTLILYSFLVTIIFMVAHTPFFGWHRLGNCLGYDSRRGSHVGFYMRPHLLWLVDKRPEQILGDICVPVWGYFEIADEVKEEVVDCLWGD